MRTVIAAGTLALLATSASAGVAIEPAAAGTYTASWNALSMELLLTGPVDEMYDASWRLLENGAEVAAGNGYDIFRLYEAPVLRLAELDPENDRPELVVSNYTGGAHCCTQVTVFSKTPSGWTEIDLGAWDGGAVAVPEDIDGNGTSEFRTRDDRFLYEFAPYAGSFAPPMILAVRGGKVVDITREPVFEWTLRAALDDMGPIPASGEERNSWLATYAATLVLLGEDDPLDYATSAFDPVPDWGMVACKAPMQDGNCPEGQQERLSFPEALERFLGVNSYLEAR